MGPGAGGVRTRWRAVLSALLPLLAPVPSWAQTAPDDSAGFWASLGETTPAGAAEPPRDQPLGFLGRTGSGIKKIWTTGGSDLFVPGYIWHMPWHYSEEQIGRYNTEAFGLGFGRTLRSRVTRPRTIYGVVSADSYSRLQYMVGYAWQARWRPGGGVFSLGGGYTALLIGRYDKLRYTPLPVALPLGSIGIDRFELMGAYVPGYEVLLLPEGQCRQVPGVDRLIHTPQSIRRTGSAGSGRR